MRMRLKRKFEHWWQEGLWIWGHGLGPGLCA